MQILKNNITGVEHPITGSLGVPREIEENTFEVWTHFSVDLGEGRVDTIEVHPESTEWEVIDVPDPEPVVEEPVVEPEPEPAPVIPEPTPEEPEIFTLPTSEELLNMSYSERRTVWHRARAILTDMLNLKEISDKTGKAQPVERLAYIEMLADYIDDNIEVGFIMSK